MKKYLIYKEQIASFEDVEETVKVVEKASAAHIHRLKERVNVLRDYKAAVQGALSRMSEFGAIPDMPLFRERDGGRRALLVVGGDKGLVGGLHHALINEFIGRKNNYDAVYVLGAKIKEYFDEEGIVPAEQFFYATPDLPSVEEITATGAGFIDRFLAGDLKSLDILYSSFVSLALQRPVFARFLPFDLRETMASEAVPSAAAGGDGFPIFAPSKKRIFDALVKKYVSVFFSEIILEAKLSEFSSRTVSAEHAVTKTQDLVAKLHQAFFRDRRNTVTEKQLESFAVHKAAQPI